MSLSYTVQSPCKINLSLLVHKQREDGYHALTSIFQMVSLYDEITIIKREDNNIELLGDFNCKPEDNLIYKAIVKYREYSGIKDGFTVKVDKQIPAGGGVGGGSGNCASVLRVLNHIYNRLTFKEVEEIGLSLGSDVPFFLHSTTALVEGRGEQITPIKTIKDYYIVLINPGIHISTAAAFRTVKEKGAYENWSEILSIKQVELYKKGIDKFPFFKNSFEFALHSDYTFISNVKKTMNNEGALYTALSGSGSTMFSIFKNKVSAVSAMKSFSESSQYKIFLVEPLKELPEIKERRV